MKPSKVLQRAIDRLDGGEKWIQGNYRSYQGMCLLGSLGLRDANEATNRNWLGHTEAIKIVAGVINEQYPEWSGATGPMGPHDLVRFNDSLSRTAEEVITVLEKAYVKSLEPRFD